MQPVLSPMAAIASSSASSSTGSRGHRGELGALGLDGLGGGPGLLDERRRDAGHRRLRERPGARELQQREAVAVGDRAQLVEPRAPRLDPARGAVAAVVGLAQRALVRHVVVEEPAVVDDAREHAHAVALAGRQREPARPGLERVEDQHRPVDQVAEALEAADDVEREAVGRPGRDADRIAQAGLAQTGHRLPDAGEV